MQNQKDDSWILELQPAGRRIPLTSGKTLLETFQQVGGEVLYAPCGGQGSCGQCRIRLLDGVVSPLSQAELAGLNPIEIDAGYRLACQVRPLGSVRVEIPSENIGGSQNLQVEGEVLVTSPAPAITVKSVLLQTTGIDCPLSIWEQIRLGLAKSGFSETLAVDPELVRRQSARAEAGTAHLLMCEAKVVDLRLKGPPFKPLGLAVDLGTTKIAAFLVDLENGATLAAGGVMNPQIAFGEDLMTRLSLAIRDRQILSKLGASTVNGIDRLTGELLKVAGRAREDIHEFVVAGNPAMHHLLLGFPVEQLGRAPYVPALAGPLEFLSRDLGLHGSSQARLYCLPAVSGFIGGDHLAMIVGAGIYRREGTVLGLDIGTNTEIVLARAGKLISCSCASGPAFEGAHIRQGMRAVSGALCRIRMSDAGHQLEWETIGDSPPLGICGSGILDAVAELIRHGIVNRFGKLNRSHPRVGVYGKSGFAFRLVAAADSGTGQDIIVAEKDIAEIQLAKAAVAAGIEILLQVSGVNLEELDEVVVAGAFGTHLEIGSAVRVGLLPDLAVGLYRQVGNAAGSGARAVLLSTDLRREAAALGDRLECLELNLRPEFSRVFARSLSFASAFSGSDQ